MESLNEKRNRLRGELREAYRLWLGSTEPGGDDAGNTKWSAYLAARLRLVEADAEAAPPR